MANIIISQKDIESRIVTFRSQQVMIDSDLATLYGVETRRLNEQVKRNIERFPEEFMFQLTKEEFDSLRSQNATLESQRGKHRKYLPYVFTEQGVAMLSAVLKSETAVKVSIRIMNAFVGMRRFLVNNADMFKRMDTLELNQEKHKLDSDKKFDKLFKALDKGSLPAKQGIFYNGQVFDAYKLISDILRTATKSIIVIDNYVDDSVLLLLTKRKNGVKATIYSNNISKTLKQDVKKHNSQYDQIELKELKTAHDRFLIIDGNAVYQFGASLKDAGKKWFAFSKLEMDAKDITGRL